MKEYKRVYDDRWSFWEADTKEYTHCYHTYPAMMIPQIARTLIRDYRPEGECKLLFDPYMGSGTSLVEASVAGIRSIGTDLNPLARLMAKVKTTHYDADAVARQLESLYLQFGFYSDTQVIDRNFERISNHSFWYSEDILLKLSFISQLIGQFDSNQDFFNLALSETVREVSFTRNGEFKRYRMNEDHIKRFRPEVFKIFENKVRRNIEGLRSFNAATQTPAATICSFNTIEGIPQDILPEESVDIVVTSPPYGDSRTTVAYGQFSRWANEWFGFENAHNLDSLLMGGSKSDGESFQTESISAELSQIRDIDKKRYSEVTSFLNDYSQSIGHVAKSIRKGGTVCYVVGNRTVKGIQIPLDYFTAESFEKSGFKHLTTIVRSIPNKRMPAKTSPSNKKGEQVSTMTHEYIVILKKGA